MYLTLTFLIQFRLICLGKIKYVIQTVNIFHMTVSYVIKSYVIDTQHLIGISFSYTQAIYYEVEISP